MFRQPLKFAIFGNIYQPEKSASIHQVLSLLSRRGAELFIDEDFYRFLHDTQDIDTGAARVFSGDVFEADFVLSMGGDGTFLQAASRVADKQIPIIGVNMGRLGFLADVPPAEVEGSLHALLDGDYSVEERVVVSVTADGRPLCHYNHALNDVAILKRDNASMISIRTTINGEYLTTYQADGLILSTPTGSTAYSLSNGGPIIVPGTSVLSLTAVAPHSLNVRPIVIPDSAVVTLEVESRNHNFLVAVDGRSEKCNEGLTVTLRKAPYKVRVVKRVGRNFFMTLREKMMWGADARE